MKKHNKIESVPYVDLEKFMGVWHEIGRYSHWFEKDADQVIIEYKKCDDYIEVANQFIKKDKKEYLIGKAYILPNCGNSKLKLQLRWPFRGDYWIIDVDQDYTWVVISNPRRTRLWILYRQSYIDDKTLRFILCRLINRGFNSAQIIWTKQ